MANTQTLMDYLMVAPLRLSTEETNKTPNTTNDQYSWRQINSVSQWSEFTYAGIYAALRDLASASANCE